MSVQERRKLEWVEGEIELSCWYAIPIMVPVYIQEKNAFWNLRPKSHNSLFNVPYGKARVCSHLLKYFPKLACFAFREHTPFTSNHLFILGGLIECTEPGKVCDAGRDFCQGSEPFLKMGDAAFSAGSLNLTQVIIPSGNLVLTSWCFWQRRWP